MAKIVVNDTEIKCKLVLFDLDGTLIDKEYRNMALAKTRYEAIQWVAGRDAADRWAYLSGVEHNSYKVDDNGPLSKAPRKEDLIVATTAIWLNGLDWFKAKQLATEAYATADVEQSRSFKPKLINGTIKVLNEMREAGLLLGIATNGSGKTAREIMASIGFENIFDVYVGADEVAEGKPEPDMIIESCNRLGVDPADSVYVGDELVDAAAGAAAGVAGIIIVSHEPDVSAYTKLVVDSVAPIKTTSSR